MWETVLQNLVMVAVYAGLGALLMLLGFAIFDKLLTRGHALSKELFTDRNPAAGLLVARFLVAEVLIIAAVILGDPSGQRLWQDVLSSAVYFAAAMLVFFLFRSLYKLGVRLVAGVDIDREIFIENNLAAAQVEGAVYLGLGLILAACVW
jgi:uncharacterized membrane protein YjfL (UPF0719 family)